MGEYPETQGAAVDWQGVLAAVLLWAARVGAVTLLELAAFGGPLLVFGALLFSLERRAFRVMTLAFGERAAVFSTGWIGTPVHELSHAIMCLVFGHRIERISLFNPDFDTRRLGYVLHSYDPGNPYQRAGNLFIGSAPLFVGGALLVGSVFLFFPAYRGEFGRLISVPPAAGYTAWDFLGSVGTPVLVTLRVIFAPQNLTAWQFWVFLYLAICLSSHLAPSGKDMEGFYYGLVVLALPVLLFNGAAVALGWDFAAAFLGLAPYVGVAAGFLAIAALLSAVSFAASYLAAALWQRATRGQWLSPC